MKLNHIHFSTPKLTKTRAFYEKYFGFHEHYRLNQTVVLTNSEHFLLALDPLAAEQPVETKSRPFHFGFCVESAEQVQSVYEHMKEEGVMFTQALKELSANAVNFYCLDPHGNIVEVGWYRNL